MWHKTDKAMKKEEVEPYVRKSLRESFDFVMQQNADLCDTDPVRYKKLVCKGIDWMAEKARHDEALQAMCMVASISLNARRPHTPASMFQSKSQTNNSLVS